MGLAPSLLAQPAFSVISNATVQPVVIVGTGTLDQKGAVTITYVRRQDGPPRTDPTLPVALPYTHENPLPSQLFYSGAAPLPVEISAIKKVGEWEPLRAKVEDAPAKARPGGGDPVSNQRK